MQSEHRAFWIGDHFHWGERYGRNATLIAGYFHDRDKKGNTVALTVRPPSGYESEYASRIEIVDGLICLLSMADASIDPDRDYREFFTNIGKDPMPFGAECELIAAHAQRMSATIVGTHRVIEIRGNVYRGLYELRTTSSAAGMAGAAIVRRGMLCGLIVGDGGKRDNGHDDYRSFAVPTHRLFSRLSPRPCTHPSDRKHANKIAGLIATLKEKEPALEDA